jgi:TPR repeat protein
MVDKAFEKLKERHGAPGEGCAFYILSFLLMALAANLLSFAINELFPSPYSEKVYIFVFSLGCLGLVAWESARADKRNRRLELRLWLKYDYPELLEKASGGCPDSQYSLGMGVRHHGCAKECGPAMFWLLMAANQGHFEAQRLVAIIYQNGEVVPKDPEKAAYWFRKAEGQNK